MVLSIYSLKNIWNIGTMFLALQHITMEGTDRHCAWVLSWIRFWTEKGGKFQGGNDKWSERYLDNVMQVIRREKCLLTGATRVVILTTFEQTLEIVVYPNNLGNQPHPKSVGQRLGFNVDRELQRLTRVFYSITVQKPQFFCAQPSLRSSSHIHTWLLEKT